MTSLPVEVQRLASGRSVAAISTIMPDGQPQTLFVWVDTDGEHLLVNTEPQRRRVKNIRRDPRVTVLMHHEGDWLDWVEVRGRVVEIVDGPVAREHIDELSLKYDGRKYPWKVGPYGRVILKIVPEHVNLPPGHAAAQLPAVP